MTNRREMLNGMICPHCGSDWMPKAARNCGRQVYRCGECGKRSVPDVGYRRATPEGVAQARAMRKGGMRVRAIAGLLGVSPAAVSRWTR